MEELARVALLLLVAALAINLITNGRDGVKKWIAAKFLGRSGMQTAATP